MSNLKNNSKQDYYILIAKYYYLSIEVLDKFKIKNMRNFVSNLRVYFRTNKAVLSI